MMTSTSSGSLTGSAVVTARPSRLCSVTLVPAAAACTLIVYDNATTNSGTILASMSLLANAKSETVSFFVTPESLKGLYAALSGSGATAVVHYALMG